MLASVDAYTILLLHLQLSGVLIKMPNLAEGADKLNTNSGQNVREDSEYVRLVIPNETRLSEADNLQPREETRIKSFIWWLKALVFCIVSIIFLLICLKWGVPFVFEKVFPILYLPFSMYNCFISFFLLD